MAINDMNHFTVLTHDLEATRQFYIGILGLKEGYRPDLGFPGAWLYVGDRAVLHIIAGRAVPDPRNQIAATMAPGQLFACHNHLDAHFVRRNEFYQDYLLPQVGIHYSLGAVDLLTENEQMILLGFHRYTGRGPFESSNSRTLECLLPHLRRSLHIAAQVQRRTDANTYSETALDASNLAALALSFSRGGDTMGESAWRGIAERRKMALSTPWRIACNECKSGRGVKKNDQRYLGHRPAG